MKYLKFIKKTFSLSNLDTLTIENGYDACIFLSICDDSKCYLFCGLYSNDPYSLNNIFIITICDDTMTILSNQRFTECIRYNRGGFLTKMKSIKTFQQIEFSNFFFK